MFDDVKDQKPGDAASASGTAPAMTPPTHSEPPAGLPTAPTSQKPGVIEDIMADTDPQAPQPETPSYKPATQQSSPPMEQSAPPQPIQLKQDTTIQEPKPMAEVPKTEMPMAEKPTPTPSMSPPSAQPVGVTPTPVNAIAWDEKENVGAKKKLLMAGIVIVVVILLGIGGYVGYVQFFAGSDLTPLTETEQFQGETEVTEPVVDETVVAEEDTTQNTTPSPLVDTDGDGLTDQEEAEYNTNPNVADTDSDGLFDREEVISWNTDPLNPDTDGDTFLDGEEVQNGYDPLGPGQLEFFGQVNF